MCALAAFPTVFYLDFLLPFLLSPRGEGVYALEGPIAEIFVHLPLYDIMRDVNEAPYKTYVVVI